MRDVRHCRLGGEPRLHEHPPLDLNKLLRRLVALHVGVHRVIRQVDLILGPSVQQLLHEVDLDYLELVTLGQGVLHALQLVHLFVLSRPPSCNRCRPNGAPR